MTYRICFVCTGNICRSPMAEAVMRGLLEAEKLDDQVEVDSAGTTSWHVGEPADRRALAALHGAGYDGSMHRARAFERSWLADRDLVVALDAGHLDELQALAGSGQDPPAVRLLRSFTDDVDEDDLDVLDPYYGSAADFATVLEQVEAGCRGILASLVRDGVVQPA